MILRLVRIAANLIALALVMVLSTPASACGDNEYNQCFLGACACLPKVGGDAGKAGEEAKRAANNLARELGKTPEAIQQCLANVRQCATEITAAPIALPVQAYIDGLYRQSEGRTYSFSPQFVALAQPYYRFNIAQVTYADDIDTGSGMSVAFCDRVFFTRGGDVWSDRVELHHVLHELEHLQQCQDRGRRTFLAEYVLKAGLDVLSHRRFDVHDVHDFEVAAENKANGIVNQVWNKIVNSRNGGGESGNMSKIPPAKGQCTASEVFMPTLGGACCTPNFARCRNLTTGQTTCGAFGCN